ncbi:MAG: twin-arginine translocation signal domain-containing protein, partial [Candidatus Dormibacteraeota bacterium]|nr:twin-arginine translocation signal domain-containing protein [Candidatus Dormibacteraeota bacterium]
MERDRVTLTRRQFLQGSAAAAFTLALPIDLLRRQRWRVVPERIGSLAVRGGSRGSRVLAGALESANVYASDDHGLSWTRTSLPRAAVTQRVTLPPDQPGAPREIVWTGRAPGAARSLFVALAPDGSRP